MKPLDIQIQAVVEILRAHGAVVGIDPEAPDFVKRAFLDMMLNGSDRGAAKRERQGTS